MLTHLMPKSRLTFDYVARLSAGIVAFSLLANSFRTNAIPAEVPQVAQNATLALGHR